MIRQVYIPDKDDPHRLILRVHLPETYPSAAAPVLELYGGCTSEYECQVAAQHLEGMFEPGEVGGLCSSVSVHLPEDAKDDCALRRPAECMLFAI